MEDEPVTPAHSPSIVPSHHLPRAQALFAPSSPGKICDGDPTNYPPAPSQNSIPPPQPAAIKPTSTSSKNKLTRPLAVRHSFRPQKQVPVPFRVPPVIEI